eukprot:GHVT01031166.1.p1 GENE.GHVT01031166.1~~GHVT01031166.1.p1  ORF type:complete len:1150 (+),score=242.83 GHVT01031166.1:277-3726(+)
MTPAVLVLADGRQFPGTSFGYERHTCGEVVFNTGMVGYPESLTDPSYEGQILVTTYPLIGNYGVPADEYDSHGIPLNFEGDRIHVSGLVVAEYSISTSHWMCTRTLSAWLTGQKIPAISGVDTRALTKHIRTKGSMLGRIVVGAPYRPEAPLAVAELDRIVPLVDLNKTNLVSAAGRNLVRTFHSARDGAKTKPNAKHALSIPTNQNLIDTSDAGMILSPRPESFSSPPDSFLPDNESIRAPPASSPPLSSSSSSSASASASVSARGIRILLVDCGMKYNILRFFLYSLPYELSIKVVPFDYPFGEEAEEFDGLFLSNGPGDPCMCEGTVEQIRKTMQRGKPIFGVCLGNQLLAIAAGAQTYKMVFGNRGMNQPVIDLRTTRCYITPQNHGYAVDAATLPAGWLEFFVNANDRSNEGIIHQIHPWFSVQFHPEASGGPTDTHFLFQDFMRAVCRPSSIPVSTVPMHFPESVNKVLLLGSGGLSIGQAGEFDYSGSQALKALKESSVHVILINPNIATVQTAMGLADKIYFLPVTPEFVEKVIMKEKPAGIMCTFGGQTALNSAVELHRSGALRRHGCRILGTPIEAIIATEDRQLFADKLAEIGEAVAPSKSATTIAEAVAAGRWIGYPVLIRAAFALGGLGSGFAETEEALVKIATEAFAHSSQLLIDKSLKGWKEIEYEVVRDCKDNCVTVCNMENLDPLGIHTGDSIVVSPSQTLSNRDYYRLRRTALKVIRHFKIVGECNIQYAMDPQSDRFYIVEVNARLSRSSALASKATGYPLAYVAAKLALGHDLVQVRNSVTRCTTACFEPSLDYVVTKIPRWDLAKFSTVDMRMGSAMKSVGEVMAIGRTFGESLQKGLRMVDENSQGFDSAVYFDGDKLLDSMLMHPTPTRIWAVARALEKGYSIDRLHELTQIDRWFLAQLMHLDTLKQRLKQYNLHELDAPMMRHAKKYGFSDRQLGSLVMNQPIEESAVRAYRLSLNVRPFVKQIDTLAAEYPACTNYLYLSYQGSEHDVDPLAPDGELIWPSRSGCSSPCHSHRQPAQQQPNSAAAAAESQCQSPSRSFSSHNNNSSNNNNNNSSSSNSHNNSHNNNNSSNNSNNNNNSIVTHNSSQGKSNSLPEAMLQVIRNIHQDPKVLSLATHTKNVRISQ